MRPRVTCLPVLKFARDLQMQQSTKLRALKFTTAASQLAKAPKTIRLFVNQSSIGFDDAESLEPAQEIVLTEEQAKGAGERAWP